MRKFRKENLLLKLIFLLFLFIQAVSVKSQQQNIPQKWDLQTCIDYALANNIQVKQAEMTKSSTEVDTKKARASLLPSLSASINQNLSNYPFSDNQELAVSSKSTSVSGSYSINASWLLFDGGSRTYSIRQADINDEISRLSIDESKNNIKLAIIQDYMQILYASESVTTCEHAVELSKTQLESNKLKLAIGSVAKSDVTQWESQLASDNYQLTNARVTLENYKLQLKQLLELDMIDTMDIVLTPPEDSEVMAMLPDKYEIFKMAMNVMPQVKSGQLNTAYSEIAISNAKAGYLPTISLQASTGTANIYNSDPQFETQLKNRWNNTLGLSVKIPIYSNREARSAVQKAQINVEVAKLNEMNVQKELHANIETAYLNALNSQAQYIAAQAKVKSSQESYDVMDEQFQLGLRNTIELLTEKNNLVSAQQQLLQAKYMFLLNRKVLDYYQGLI
jgi:outer membrane protein